MECTGYLLDLPEGSFRHMFSVRATESALLQVKVAFRRDHEMRSAIMVRMSVERLHSIRDWLEVQSHNASHAHKKMDNVALQYSSEMLQGLIQILVEHQEYEQMVVDRISQVFANPFPKSVFSFLLIIYENSRFL